MIGSHERLLKRLASASARIRSPHFVPPPSHGGPLHAPDAVWGRLCDDRRRFIVDMYAGT